MVTNVDYQRKSSTRSAATNEKYIECNTNADFTVEQLEQLRLDDLKDVNGNDNETEDEEEEEEDLLFNDDDEDLPRTSAPTPSSKRRKGDIVKEKAGPEGRVKYVKTELLAFLLFFAWRCVK